MIVLDTHIWLWWTNHQVDQLSESRYQQISLAGKVGVSAISCFEVAWLEHHGRISLPCSLESWFAKSLGESDITLLPITPAIAGSAVHLPEHHSDPQDRIIIATALVHDAKLMSNDGKFPKYIELKDRLL